MRTVDRSNLSSRFQWDYLPNFGETMCGRNITICFVMHSDLEEVQIARTYCVSPAPIARCNELHSSFLVFIQDAMDIIACVRCAHPGSHFRLIQNSNYMQRKRGGQYAFQSTVRWLLSKTAGPLYIPFQAYQKHVIKLHYFFFFRKLSQVHADPLNATKIVSAVFIRFAHITIHFFVATRMGMVLESDEKMTKKNGKENCQSS